MKQAWRAADRAAELLAAARGWLAAGIIDEKAFGSIAADQALAGPRLGPIWRALVFACVVVGVSTATAIGFISFGLRGATGVGSLLLIFGAALAVTTDVIIERSAYQPTGGEAATSLLAAGYICSGAYVLLDEALRLGGARALPLTYLWCAAVFALAAWRWGIRLYAGVAVVFVLLLSAQVPGARPAWILVAALCAAGASVVNATRDLAPSHRDGIELARLVALGAIYVAVNYYSVDQGWLEEIGRVIGGPHPRAGHLGLTLAAVGSAAYPLGLLAWGLRSRSRALIGMGILAAALSLTTIRFYIHVAPLWAVLAAAGGALAGASLLLERWLRSGRDAERFGFTAAPLYDEGRRERLLPVAAALALAPQANALPQGSTGAAGKGGSFGGGGVGGTF